MANRIISKIYNNYLPWRVWYFCEYIKRKHEIPNLLDPQNYSQYIFRDNILGRHNKHAYLADKYRVRDYVAEKGLSGILTRLYGAWDDANAIDFSTLPNGFAIKCNHSCGMNIICQDKNTLDIEVTRNQLNEWLKTTHEEPFEQHYKQIKPMIICEELIPCNEDGSFPYDYKIHCANGKPIYIQCCFERTSNSVGFREIYSPDWKNLHYVVKDYHYAEEEVPRPKHLDEMLKYASILSKGLQYARVDFYDTEDRVIFGEITLTPMGGWLSYFTKEALCVMGNAIKNKNNERKHE